MDIIILIRFILSFVTSALCNIQWSNYALVQKVQSEIFQISNENSRLNYHVEIDWLVAFVSITVSIVALVASDRIVYKLKNKQTKSDWRDQYK